MAYTTLDDLVARAGEDEILQVADRNNDGTADADVIAGAIASAEADINAFVATRYALPLTTVPDVVKGWATSIARYYLHRDGPPDHVVRDWKAATDSLRDVARGNITLPLPTGEAPAGDSAGQVALVKADDCPSGFGGFL